MIVSTIQTSNCTPQTIVIGRRGTYDTLQIVFDLAYLIENYGNGTAVLAIKRSQDESAYPAVVTQEDTTLLWTVNETDTAYVGSGECQLMWYVDGGLAKTIIYPMVVMRDILTTAEEPPDGYENWIEHLTGLGAETQQNAQDAAQSASDAEDAKDDAVTAKEAAEDAQEAAETAVLHYPKIENGYWYVWDVTAQAYQNTNIKAEGEDGYSPEVTITSIEGGHRVTITDKDHPQGQSFDVLDGQGGGTSDYAVLSNKPKINNVELNGNKTAHDLGLAAQTDIPTVPVQSVNGKTGAVNLASGDIAYDESATYQAGSVGAELQEQNRHLSDLEDTVSTTQIINTASGAIASFDDGADGQPIRKLVANIEPVQEGTGDPSPDNVRPISGWTGAEIEQSGVNVWDEETELGYWNVRDGSASGSTSELRSKNFIPVTPNTQYYFNKSTDNRGDVLFFGKDQEYLHDYVPSVANRTFTTPDNCYYIKINFGNQYGAIYNHDVSINYPATDTTYHPYTGNQISVNWEDEAGTIYGGKVTLNEDGSADVVSNSWFQEFTGEEAWYDNTVSGNKKYFLARTIPIQPVGGIVLDIKSSIAKYDASLGAVFNIPGYCMAYGFTASEGWVGYCFDPDDMPTVEDFKSFLAELYANGTPAQIYAKLRTEEHYHFDNIGQLQTFLGTNNIWSSTGDAEVEYPCDTKLYIDNKITQAIANALNS